MRWVALLRDRPVYIAHAAAVGAIDRSTHRFGQQGRRITQRLERRALRPCNKAASINGFTRAQLCEPKFATTRRSSGTQ